MNTHKSVFTIRHINASIIIIYLCFI